MATKTKTAGQFLAEVMRDKGLTISDISASTNLSPAAVRRALNDTGQRSRATVRRLTQGAGMNNDQARRLAELSGYSPAIISSPIRDDLAEGYQDAYRYLAMLLEALAGPELTEKVRSRFEEQEAH